MTVVPYLRPEIVNGRTKGNFRLVYVAQREPQGGRRASVPVASALLIAAPLSALLWAMIAIFVI